MTNAVKHSMHCSSVPVAIAFIPARFGSERLPGKNIKLIAGHPLIAYTISAAKQSGVFSRIIVSTDSPEYARIAIHYGAEVPFLRPVEYAQKNSPDIDWVKFHMNALAKAGERPCCFSILRPTSPFRQPETIRRAWNLFSEETGADSLRAVEVCKQHPGKMWRVAGKRMSPLLPFSTERQPWHSSAYQELPEVYIQNSSLEIAWSTVLDEYNNISGAVIVPFITKGYEGFDLNVPEDWERAVFLINSGKASLPVVHIQPYPEGGV